MSDFLRGVVDFWRIAVFRKELLQHYFDAKTYCAGYLTGCLLMFLTAVGVATGAGMCCYYWANWAN